MWGTHKYATSAWRVDWPMFLHRFDVFPVLLEYKKTAKWDLLVLYRDLVKTSVRKSIKTRGLQSFV